MQRERIAMAEERSQTLETCGEEDIQLCLPSLIMGNVRSLGNKMDELTVLTWSHQEYLECSLMIFSKSWLRTDVPEHNVSTEGFPHCPG